MSDLAKSTIDESPIAKIKCALDQLAAHSDPAVKKQAKQLLRDIDDLLDRTGRALHLSMAQTEAVMREHDKLLAAMVDVKPNLPSLMAMVTAAATRDERARAG